MSKGAGSFEKAFEDLIRRVLREEVAASALGRGTTAGAAAAPDFRASTGPGLIALNQAINGILQPTGQTDIMGATLRGALTLAGRCTLFVRRGDNFSAWHSEGYSSQTASAIRSVSVSAVQPGIFQDICDTQRPLCCQPASGTLPKELEQALGSAVGPNLCLLPVLVQGKVVAALFSDAGGDAGSEGMSGLEIVARVAGLSLETAASRVATEPAGGPAAEVPAAMEATAESAPLETPAAQSATQATADAPPSRGSFADGFPVASEDVPPPPPPPDADALPDAERDSHKKAHRFARVAVQDLISYHKDKIEQGRKNKNLFTVLKEDIDKTRENYQKRFGQTPARAFDYLHFEMVSKLAGNDLSVLGDQYPGPWAGE